MRKALFLICPTLSLMACAVLSAPLAALQDAPTPSASSTVEPPLSPTPRPSATAQPTETPTATLEPWLSLLPTRVPPSLSVLPTRVTLTPAPTPTVPAELDCQLIWQSPANGAVYHPREDFTAGWKVTNSGTAAWEADAVTFTYLGGAKFYDYPVIHLERRVAPEQAVVLSVDMRAPRNSTTYTTYWSLRRGDVFFCRVMLSIYVE